MKCHEGRRPLSHVLLELGDKTPQRRPVKFLWHSTILGTPLTNLLRLDGFSYTSFMPRVTARPKLPLQAPHIAASVCSMCMVLGAFDMHERSGVL